MLFCVVSIGLHSGGKGTYNGLICRVLAANYEHTGRDRLACIEQTQQVNIVIHDLDIASLHVLVIAS